MRPRRISQRGLCGMPKRVRKKKTAGRMATPSFQRHSSAPKPSVPIDVVGEVGDQDSGHDIELEEADEASAFGGGRDFRDVHGADDGGAADGESADKAEPDEGVPVPGERAPQGGDDIEDGEGLQALAAAVAIAGRGGEHGAEDGAEQRAGDGEAEQHGREVVDLGKGAGGAGDDDGVEAEEESAEGGDDGAFQEISIHGLADAWYPAPRGKSNVGE